MIIWNREAMPTDSGIKMLIIGFSEEGAMVYTNIFIINIYY